MVRFSYNKTAVELPAHKLVFFAVPKVASSSIKKMLFEVVHGVPFQAKNPDGSNFRVHQDFSPTWRFQEIPPNKYEGWTKVTLVRDPVERVLSAYANRVLDLNILSEKWVERDALDRLELSYDPPIDHFLKNITKYRLLSRPIWHHTNPFTAFLGPDLGVFDHVFTFDQLDALVAFFAARTGIALELPPPTNSSKTRLLFSALGRQAQQNLLELFQLDITSPQFIPGLT